VVPGRDRRPPVRRPGAQAGEKFLVAQCRPDARDDSQDKFRRFSPRIMRHTAASRLVQARVPPYDVQALLGWLPAAP
jgi:integrase